MRAHIQYAQRHIGSESSCNMEGLDQIIVVEEKYRRKNKVQIIITRVYNFIPTKEDRQRHCTFY